MSKWPQIFFVPPRLPKRGPAGAQQQQEQRTPSPRLPPHNTPLSFISRNEFNSIELKHQRAAHHR